MWEEIRKFGLQYCDLPTVLWNVSSLLRALALDIDSRQRINLSVFSYILTGVTAACYFYMFVINMTWFVFWRCAETGELLAAIIVFSLMISSAIGILKLLFIFLNQSAVKGIVEDYLACDALVIPDTRFSMNIFKRMRKVKRRAIIFWMILMANGFIYFMKPLFRPGRHFADDMYTIYGLEPINVSPNYEIGLLILIGSLWFICYTPASITALLIILVGYIEAQMLALKVEVANLWADATQYYEEKTDAPNQRNANHLKYSLDGHKFINKYIAKRLRDLTIIHARNINLLRKTEKVFTFAIIGEFVLLVISILAELLGGLENTYITIPFVIIQVVMDCLSGQYVTDASNAFETAVYDCKWEIFDVSNKKIVLLILQNSQKSMTLSGGGMIRLNFSCLLATFKMLYSGYTALQSTMNKNGNMLTAR